MLTLDAELADAGGGHERGETENRIHAEGVTLLSGRKQVRRTGQLRSWRRGPRVEA